MSNVDTITGEVVPANLLTNYFGTLVNQFFKILPMRENEEDSLEIYIKSLQLELLGCRSFIPELQDNPMYLTLLSILQYFVDNNDCPVCDVKREVFKAISICNKLKDIYKDMKAGE